MQVKVLRVFRIKFDFSSQKLSCRFNLLAKDRVRVLHLTSSVTIAILDLVLVIISSNARHLGRSSNFCSNAFSLVLEDRHLVLLRLIFHEKG